MDDMIEDVDALKQEEIPELEKGPFDKTPANTRNLMAVMMFALIIDAGVGIYHYGLHALLLILVSVATALAAELILSLVLRRGFTIADYSAAVTGMILGLLLPPSAPLYVAAIGAGCGIAVKAFTGGIGRNFLNPAMTGKLILLLAFPTVMNDFSTDLYGSATPLSEMMLGNAFDLKAQLFGNVSATIGTGSALVILILVAFLVLTDVVDLLIPINAVLGLVIVLILFGHHGWSPLYLGINICGGGFLFAAGFMATDYTTSPITIRGKVLYGLLFGAATAGIRLLFGISDNAVVYSLLAVNLLARPLDMITMPRPFGRTKKIIISAKKEVQGDVQEDELIDDLIMKEVL